MKKKKSENPKTRKPDLLFFFDVGTGQNNRSRVISRRMQHERSGRRETAAFIADDPVWGRRVDHGPRRRWLREAMHPVDLEFDRGPSLYFVPHQWRELGSNVSGAEIFDSVKEEGCLGELGFVKRRSPRLHASDQFRSPNRSKKKLRRVLFIEFRYRGPKGLALGLGDRGIFVAGDWHRRTAFECRELSERSEIKGYKQWDDRLVEESVTCSAEIKYYFGRPRYFFFRKSENQKTRKPEKKLYIFFKKWFVPPSSAAAVPIINSWPFPFRFWFRHRLPENWTVEGVAAVIKRQSRRMLIDVPILNGFCMFIKKRVVDTVGFMDDIAFPNGFGEENDFSMRTIPVLRNHGLIETRSRFK